MIEQNEIKKDSNQWIFQVWASFVLSMFLTVSGIYFLPCDFWVKGYMIMGVIFTVGSTFSLAKTIRDTEESRKLLNRISSAKTEKLLTEFEYKSEIKK